MEFFLFCLSILGTTYASENNGQSCTFHFAKLAEVLESPNYPETDLLPTTCTYTITAPKGHRIELMIAHIDLSNSTDFLTIFDGYQDSFPALDTLTGAKFFLPMRTYESTTNHLFVRFDKSSTTGNHSGFRACYRVIAVRCGGELMSSDHGKIAHTFPGVPGDTGTCVWVIQAPSGYSIRLQMRQSDGSADDSLMLVKFQNKIFETIPAYGSGLFWSIQTVASPIVYVIYQHKNSGEDTTLWLDYSFVHYSEVDTRLGRSQRFKRSI